MTIDIRILLRLIVQINKGFLFGRPSDARQSLLIDQFRNIFGDIKLGINRDLTIKYDLNPLLLSNLRGSVAIVAPRSSSEDSIVCSNSKRLSRHSNCRARFERNCVARKNADRSSWICRSPSLICARVISRQARSKTQLLRRNILHFFLGHVVHWPDNLFLSSQEISVSSPMLYPAAGGCHGFLDRCESNQQSPEITRACISRFGDTSSSYAPISFPGNPGRPVNVVQPKVPERTDTPILSPNWECLDSARMAGWQNPSAPPQIGPGLKKPPPHS